MNPPRSPFEIPKPPLASSSPAWVTPRSWICIAFTVATLLSFGVSLWGSVKSSYAAWAAGGIAASALIFVGPIVGLGVLVVELKDQHRRAALWPALLLGICGLSLLLVLGMAFVGF